MDRREARLALELARQWAAEKLLPATSLQTLEARYAEDARQDPNAESFGSGVLYGLGGVLLGAAAFALLVLLEDNGIIDNMTDTAPWLLLAWGLVCVVGALVVDLVVRKPSLADAFHVASLVAVTASGFPRADELPLGFLAMAFGGAILGYRRTRFLVPFLALVAINFAYASILFGRIARTSTEEVAFTFWFLWAALQLPFLIVASRQTKWPWPTFSLAAATLLLAGTAIGFYGDVLEDGLPNFDGDIEIFIALLMAGALGVGLWLREKGMVLAAALVVAIDAIVFAFDVGEIIGGLIAILAVAGLLIWQAGSLRRYLRET